MKGKFIVIEGLDGSGKSTQIDFIKEVFHNIITTSEPTDSPIGQTIRHYLFEKSTCSDDALSLLFAADREVHLEEIKNSLAKGINVVCDRYIYSNLAYQRSALTRKLNKNFLRPDLVLFIDTEPVTCLNRIASRDSSREKFDDIHTLKKIRSNYYKVFKEEAKHLKRHHFGHHHSKIVIIDGNQDIVKVRADVKNAILDVL